MKVNKISITARENFHISTRSNTQSVVTPNSISAITNHDSKLLSSNSNVDFISKR